MTKESPKYYQRFSLAQRILHVIMATCFITLATTGLVQNFSVYRDSPRRH
jgi:cytochrome b subunit of formate dehydrogenase